MLDPSIAPWPIGYVPNFNASPNYYPNIGYGPPATNGSVSSPAVAPLSLSSAYGYRIANTNYLSWPAALTQDSGDFTGIWVGAVPNGGSLFGRGEDGFGNGWSIGVTWITGNQIDFVYIDSSPAGFTLSVTITSGWTNGDIIGVAASKNGNIQKLYIMGYRTGLRNSGTQTNGNGSMRSSTVGWLLGRKNGSTGDNTPIFFALANKALADKTVWGLLENPWSALTPVSRVWSNALSSGGAAPAAPNFFRRRVG